MKDKTLRDVLRNLNKGKGKNLIFKRPIADNIEFARAWIWEENRYAYKSQNFFLIRNDNGKYVATVCGTLGFHWYKEKFVKNFF